jgi:hypothetical protein
MDDNTFIEFEKELETKIVMVEEFVARAHEEGISTFEAIAMQNHVRRQFSAKQRSNLRQQIASLYRAGKITIEQKQKMDGLLDKASHIADEHFLLLSKIVPEGQELHKLKGAPDIFEQHYGDQRAKRVLKFLGFNFDKKEAS